MKKFVLLFFVLMCTFCTFAATNSSDFAFPEDSFENLIYTAYKNDPYVPALYNATLGFGIGSKIQGDDTFATAFLVVDSCCIASVTAGTVMLVSAVSRFEAEANNYDKALKEYQGKIRVASLFVAAGALGTLASRIIQTIHPFNYSNEKNTELYNNISLGIFPLLDTNSREYSVTFTGQINL